jgi:hypothetical protein
MSQRRPRTIRNKGVIAAARAQRAPTPGPRLPFQTDALTRRLVRPPLIAALATAPAIGLLVLATILSPDEPWLRLVWLCFFVALEGAYTAAWLNNPDSRGVDRMTYRAAEVFLLVVLSRIVSWALFGDGLPSPEEMRVYLAAPMSFFVTGGFFTTTFVTLVAWYMAVTLGRIFAQMDVGVEEMQFYTLATAEQKAQADNRPIPISRGELQERYLRLWLFGGMVMVLMAALSTFEVAEFATVESVLAITRLGLRPAMLFALLLYFLTGLWLLSHARLLRLNAQWLADGVGKDAGLERSWQRSSLTLLLLIALGAAFLPIGSTLGISHILRLALNAILYVVGLIYSAIGLLFAAALTMLTRNAEQGPLPTPQPMPTMIPPPVAPPPAAPNPTFAFIVSSAFWALLIALAVGALLYFLRERGYRLEVAQARRAAATLRERLRDLWLRLRRRARVARYNLRQRLRGPAAPADGALPGAGLRLSRPRSLSPREQIRYYYLSVVHRAGERGVPRAESETPLEYVRDLKTQWPEAESELDELTQAFVEARYSPQPIDRPAVARVKEEWKRVRERLRSSARRP